MIEALLAYVRQNWETFFRGICRPKHISFLLQSRSRVIVFIFADGSRSPVAVAKVCRNEHTVPQAQREHDNLIQIHARVGAEIGATIPSPIAFERIGGYAVMLERYHAGQLMTISVGRKAMHEFERNTRAAFDWLIAFQREAVCEPLFLDRAAIEAEIITPITECYRQAGRHVGGIQLDRWRELALSLEGITLPQVYMQGDLSNSNILLSRGKVVGVVDWEFSAPNTWPLYDCFQFLFEYGIEWYKKMCPGYTRWEIAKAMLHDMFLSDTLLWDKVQRWATHFGQAHGLPERGLPLYFMRYLWDLYWPDDKPTLLNLILDGVETHRGIFATL